MVTRLTAWMVLALGIAVSVSLILGVSVPLANAKEEFTIRFGGGGPVDHPISQGQIAFKKYAEELSGGRLKVEVYHASQLGGIVDMFENVKLGTLTMSHAGTPFVSRVAPLFELVSLPFLFDKRERALAFVDEPTGGMMSSELEKAGLKAIAWFELGFRHITNSNEAAGSHPGGHEGAEDPPTGKPA